MPSRLIFNKIKKQTGGTEPNVNPDWCDGHHSQCMDVAPSCQKGGTDSLYKKYKKYKLKYKLSLSNKSI